MFHGVRPTKLLAHGAIKSIFEHGIEEEFESDWKTRGYDTRVFAGYGKPGGEDSLAAVIVREFPQNQTLNGKYYLRERIGIEAVPSFWNEFDESEASFDGTASIDGNYTIGSAERQEDSDKMVPHIFGCFSNRRHPAGRRQGNHLPLRDSRRTPFY